VLAALCAVILVLDLFQPLEAMYKNRIRSVTLFIEYENIDDLSAITQTITSKNAVIHDIDVEQAEREDDLWPSAVLRMRFRHG